MISTKIAYITASAAMMGMIATVWAAVVDPRYARPEDLKPVMEQVNKNEQMIVNLAKAAATETRALKVGIFEMRIDIINTRLIELEAIKRQRSLRADEIYQQKELEAKLQRVTRELKRVESTTMIRTKPYKGYVGSIEYDINDDRFVGKILFIDDLVTYETKYADQVQFMFECAVDDYLQECKMLRKQPEIPKEVSGA